MSRLLELPDPVYAALEQVAASSGLTPAGWIAAHVSRATAVNGNNNGQRPTLTLAERFAGRIGVIDTGGRARAAENIGERFAEHLAAKRRAGRL